MDKKYFFIIYGPTGSGKGYIESFLFDYVSDKLGIGVDKNKLFRSVIDNYVEKDSEYIDKTCQYVKLNWTIDDINYVKKNINQIINDIISKKSSAISNKLTETSSQLSNIYFEIRRKYNIINDETLIKSINNHDHIIFETTGFNDYNWIFNQNSKFLTQINRLNYLVILVYPFVDAKIIIDQIITRFFHNAVKILTGDKSFARLPNLTILMDSIETIKNNFTNYLQICNQTIDMNDYIIFIDNRTREPKKPDFVLFKKCGIDETKK